MMRAAFLVVAVLLLSSQLHTLVNPFSCKRPLPVKAVVGPVQLRDFEFIGVVRSGSMWRAVVRWQDRTRTLGVGEHIGPVHIVAIDSTNIRIICKNKEFILTIKSE